MPLNMGVSFIALGVGLALPNIVRYWLPIGLDKTGIGDGQTFKRRTEFLTRYSADPTFRLHAELLGTALIQVNERNRPAWMRVKELEEPSLYKNIQWKPFDALCDKPPVQPIPETD